MQMPPTLNSILPQVALELVIAAIMANPCLQSVSDLEIMYRYRFIKKKSLFLRRNTESERGIYHHSVTPPIATLQTALILIPELF